VCGRVYNPVKVMRAYVLGAGASYPIYPLAGELFATIDKFIRGFGPIIDRFDYQNDWAATLKWLENSSDPLLAQSYRNGNIEQIFTVLDLAETLIQDSLISIFRAGKRGAAEVQVAEASHQSFSTEVKEYRNIRQILLRAIEAYFLDRNDQDLNHCDSENWANLSRFAELLQPDDVVITFNYDSTVERVLLRQRKWSPVDGYGTSGSGLVFQRSRQDQTPVPFTSSPIKVLHLHGAVGWYPKPIFSSTFDLRRDGAEAIPRAALSPAPLEAEIALDPILLRGLGIDAVDASMPERPSAEYPKLLHPSFLKAYGEEEEPSGIFPRVWALASEALRRADEVTVIGYSLPAADSAAWTLLHTSCERGRTTVVNPSKSVIMSRYAHLVTVATFAKAIDFGTWLDSRVSAAPKP